MVDEFKTLVREAHKAGIEVILDVVFNHTAEGNEQGPSVSFRRACPTTAYESGRRCRRLDKLLVHCSQTIGYLR